eukprot:m.92969 g.92969  ORF g.92969 m.92969 type:complete len:118 (-) comp14682_c1_seq1:249-602(-)
MCPPLSQQQRCVKVALTSCSLIFALSLPLAEALASPLPLPCFSAFGQLGFTGEIAKHLPHTENSSEGADQKNKRGVGKQNTQSASYQFGLSEICLRFSYLHYTLPLCCEMSVDGLCL